AIQRSRVGVGQVGSATPVPRSETEAGLPTGFLVKGSDPSPFLVTFAGRLRDVPAIGQAAAGPVGRWILPRRDAMARRVPSILQAQGAMVPSRSMEPPRVVADSGAILVRADAAGVQSVAVPGLELPSDENGRLWVHFNRHDPGRYISANDVLQGRV